MADATVTVTLNTAELDRIAGGLGLKTEDNCTRFAFEVEQVAKTLAPYDTGALSNSIATVTRSENGNDAAAAAAQDKNPNVELVTIPVPSEPYIFAHVGPCVNYGIYQELGTSRMAAQPYLLPGTEQVRARYNSGAEWRAIIT